MPRRLSSFVVLVAICLPGVAAAQITIYPVPWPKAGGGTLVAVPIADGDVNIYHLVGAPHGTAYDTPFPSTPEQSLSPAPADVPIILQAPVSPTDPSADEDHFYILISTQQLVVSMADDERSQPGSPDRIFFFPATSGTFRGRTFYGESNGGDPSERLRVINVGNATASAELFAWVGGSWVSRDTISVAPGDDGSLDPSDAMTAHKVVSSEDALVINGYLGDNATAPAVDVDTGLTVGSKLLGYGSTWHLRAVDSVDYVIEWRGEGSTTWTLEAQGSLGADEASGGTASGGNGFVRITLTGGVGWAVVGTPSLLSNTEWNGYFLPAQSRSACLMGQSFFTNSSARTISMLPNAGTTVSIYEEATDTLVNTYTSAGPWEFHNFFWPEQVRVEFTNGFGGVMLVGTLNWGGCDESTVPASCGILEGGYSIPGITGFKCGGVSPTLADCIAVPDTRCGAIGPVPDGGPITDGGPSGDAATSGDGTVVTGSRKRAGPDGGCQCGHPLGPNNAGLFLVILLLGISLVRRRTDERRAPL